MLRLSPLLLLVACATGPAPIEARFVCDGGLELRAVFTEGMVTVTSRDGAFALPQQRSGSGYWYSDGRHGLRGKGREARWEVGRMVPISCREG